MQVKPYQVLLYVIAVFATIGVIIWLFPEDGLQITDDIKLEFATFDEIFNQQKVEYKDISDIVDTDTTETPVIVKLADTVSVEVAHLKDVKNEIQFPNGLKNILYSFFKHLGDSSQLIRVLHYGDSQLEGDRMTSFIRTNLQRQFGGSGPGLLPAKQPYNYGITIRHSYRGWYRFSTMEHSRYIKGKRFGVLAGFSRFAPMHYTIRIEKEVDKDEPDSTEIETTGTPTDSLSAPNDSVASDTMKAINKIKDKLSHVKTRVITYPAYNPEQTYSASVILRQSDKTYESNHHFTRFKLIYGYNEKPVTAKLSVNNRLISTEVLPPNRTTKIMTWKVNSPKKIALQLSGNDSPDVYALALDDTFGIAVDNVPMRGSAGYMFTQMNRAHLAHMLKLLNVKLMIMQFGGNVTPYITDDYQYYKDGFSAQLRVLKEINPELAIIVIGPADMSRRVKGQLQSYPSIPYIRDVLREAAFENGAAFWDMYEAMGGKNSMPSWVNHKPPLAAKDYTHFSRKGAEIISRMFFNALIKEYNEYLIKTAK